jgi:hypothetical protein
MVLGGTGAVGGTAVLHLLSLYEEMFSYRLPDDDDVPVLVATGTSADEIRAFTRRLHRFLESRHGRGGAPQAVRRGFLTASGVFVALERFHVTALPGLSGLAQTPVQDRRGVVEAFLADQGVTFEDEPETIFKALSASVFGIRPFSAFLRKYRDDHLARQGVERFRSVVVGIPVPTLIAYQVDELGIAVDMVEGLGPSHLEELKERFVDSVIEDLASVQRTMADSVLVAHTTGVGGMYDDPERPGDPPVIRLGFAHAGRDRWMADKARFARELTDHYARAGIKVLVTAAAIGIDEVRVRERIPLHRHIRRRLLEAPVDVVSGVGRSAGPAEGSTARRRRGRGRAPASAASGPAFLTSFPPLTLPFDDPPPGPASFPPGDPIVPSYAIRSGENGFFTVADAESLYRVMRVASADELGLVLATVGLLGEDPHAPWFSGNVCYYGETDNSRQVLDFLAQPPLFATQLSGLEPLSLQDLGSAKHQAELHALGLLILAHRLGTLDVDALDPYVDLTHFDARAFFVERSRPLTFEDVALWEFTELARDVSVLAGAERAEDLLPLTAPRDHGLFPGREQALHQILEEVLRAVWTGPSLGLPIVFERDGASFLRTGYYVAPLDLLVTERDAVAAWFRSAHRGRTESGSFDDVRDYHLAVGGFIDVRPHAIVCTARSDEEPLEGRVARFDDVDAVREHLFGLEPYSFFSTCGLLALWHRLSALSGLLRESLIELGTLHEFRWQMPRDAAGHTLVVPGVVEALRMVSEGLEKTTGTERLDGLWGYERRPVPDRRGRIPGVRSEPHPAAAVHGGSDG